MRPIDSLRNAFWSGGSSILLRHLQPSNEQVEVPTETSTSHAINACHNKHSFLGVANRECLNTNMVTCVFLLVFIIVASIMFESVLHWLQHRIKCPQLRRIINRIFEELTILGFVSMIIFAMNTSGVLKHLTLDVTGLTPTEKLHFYEFFHYLVFMTMIFFILIILWLLFMGTVVPRLLWKHLGSDQMSSRHLSQEQDNRTENTSVDALENGNEQQQYQLKIDDQENPEEPMEFDTREGQEEFLSAGNGRRSALTALSNDLDQARNSTIVRQTSGMDLVEGTRAYALLAHRYERESSAVGFWFNLKKQWKLWKSLELLAYNICQNRSGYIYKNPLEMERLFGVNRYECTGFERYHVLCMRNLLFHMAHLRYSVFVILVAVVLVPSLVPPDDETWVFMGVGMILLVINVAIFFKVLQILHGIVRDRLQIVTEQDMLLQIHEKQKRQKRKKKDRKQEIKDQVVDRKTRRQTALRRFRVAVNAVRVIVRLQMSALCHSQLHYHDHRFWFKKPLFLLRLFQFATIGQSFYLVWLVLVEVQDVLYDSYPALKLSIMFGLPAIVLFVITPLTLPSFVLIMSLTGIFVEMNDPDARVDQDSIRQRFALCFGTKKTRHHEENHELAIRDRIRRLRAGYLRAHHLAPHALFENEAPRRLPTRPPSVVSCSMHEPCSPANAPSNGLNQTPRESEGMYMRMYHDDGSPLPSPLSGSIKRCRSPAGESSSSKSQTAMTKAARGRWSVNSPATSKLVSTGSSPQLAYIEMEDCDDYTRAQRSPTCGSPVPEHKKSKMKRTCGSQPDLFSFSRKTPRKQFQNQQQEQKQQQQQQEQEQQQQQQQQEEESRGSFLSNETWLPSNQQGEESEATVMAAPVAPETTAFEFKSHCSKYGGYLDDVKWVDK